MLNANKNNVFFILFESFNLLSRPRMPAIQAGDFYLVATEEASEQTDTTENGSADKGFTQPKAFLIGRELGRATFRASDFIKLVGHGLFNS